MFNSNQMQDQMRKYYHLLKKIVVEGKDGGGGHIKLMEYAWDEACISSQLTTMLV